MFVGNYNKISNTMYDVNEIQHNILRLSKIYPDLTQTEIIIAIDDIQNTGKLTQLKLFTIILELGKSLNDTKTGNRNH